MIRVGCVVFCLYILLGDIPLYLSKKSEPKSVAVSLSEITAASALDESWDFWRGEAMWMTGYFTFGAWGSLLLSYHSHVDGVISSDYVQFAAGMASWGTLVLVCKSLPLFQEHTSHSHRWLSYLTTVGTFNLLILAAVLSCVGITKMSACGILYVSSTSFRSFFPQSVTSRTTLRSYPPFSTAFHDRTVATIGELAFTYQLILHFEMPFAIFYMISFAQTVCWIAVLTGYPILHEIENSLWGLLACAILYNSKSSDIMIRVGSVLLCL